MTARTTNDPADISANAVLDRLKERLPAASDKQLAVLMEAHRDNVQKWRRRNSVPYDKVVAVCVRNGVDLDWILTGRFSPCLPGEIAS